MEKIKCYTCCYGGYVLAVGAGCTLGVSWPMGNYIIGSSSGLGLQTKMLCQKWNLY